MTGTMWCATAPVVVAAGDRGETLELVRGNEKSFVERFAPVVQRESVSLDLGLVERIDAAGLAALISLYCDACKAGQSFTIANPTPHVREILALVGLDRVLMAQEEPARPRFEHCAA